MSTTPHYRVILGFARDDYADIGDKSQNIQTCMLEAASTFTAVPVTMAALQLQVTSYTTAHLAVVRTKAVGSTEARDVQRDALFISLESLRSYVQTMCDQAPANAANLVKLAGMELQGHTVAEHPILKLTLLPGTGSVKAQASAKQLVAPGGGTAKQRTYLFRYTINGGQSYVVCEGMPVAHITITGLPLNTVVGVAVAVKDDVGTSAWSQTFTINVY
jgi:hypothetical protein